MASEGQRRRRRCCRSLAPLNCSTRCCPADGGAASGLVTSRIGSVEPSRMTLLLSTGVTEHALHACCMYGVCAAAASRLDAQLHQRRLLTSRVPCCFPAILYICLCDRVNALLTNALPCIIFCNLLGFCMYSYCVTAQLVYIPLCVFTINHRGKHNIFNRLYFHYGCCTI